MKHRLSTLLAFVLAIGCGSSSTGASPASEPGAGAPASGSEASGESTPAPEAQSAPDDGMQVEGILGTIPRTAARNALQAKMPRFLQCFANRAAEVDVLGGRADLLFHVATDGSVAWARLTASTVGDRVTERCLLDVAATVRFPRPEGGEAEVTDAIDVPLPADVRPPLDWTEARVSQAVRRLASARRSCRVGDATVNVTAYVGPGGEVLAAGAAASVREADDTIDCVVEAVRSASFPDPGSYPAKVRFALP